MKLCLNMIVKNEAARIERALLSVIDYIDGWVICDTGSTDATPKVIEEFFRVRGITGCMVYNEFHDWSQARNAALNAARDNLGRYPADYFLLMDADMELVIKDKVAFLSQITGPSYDMWQQAGSLVYMNRRLVSAAVTGKYRGVTHEYLDVAAAGCVPKEVAYFVDHADGSNRPDKYKRDIRLLTADLKKDPKNARSMFYLAQSFRDAGKPERAAAWYKRRVEAGGWDEEVWQAQVNYAHCMKDMGLHDVYIAEMLQAYHLRPQRAESMFDLAHYYRNKSMNAPALACAEAVEHIASTTDALFVNDYVYKVGIKEEISIASFYVPGKKCKGLKATSDLSLLAGPYGHARELARNNLYHYLEPLKEFCPSFVSHNIAFTPEPGWVAMNPSITLHGNHMVAIVRCVNYRIDPEGRYIIQASDGTANAENPIHTRNFLLSLTDDLAAHQNWGEVLPPVDMPCEFSLVIGFEDMRLISWSNQLWASSTVRQIHPDGNCEQVLTTLRQSWCRKLLNEEFVETYDHHDTQRMLRQPRATEKNWAPIVERNWQGDGLKFMWRPGEVVDTEGATVVKHDTGMATGHISGGSQLIPWANGWLAVVHEARCLPGSHLRYYYHRFAQYNHDFSLKKLSLPFVFDDRVIEFCAGMCAHPNGRELVISYGYKDEEARIARVFCEEVGAFLAL